MNNEKLQIFKKSINSITNTELLIDSFENTTPTSIRVNPNKITSHLPFDHVPWTDFGYYLKSRPLFTLDPLIHAGAYYVQEASSMFLEQIITPLAAKPIKVLDLCAAPGGKSTHTISLLQRGSLLISNEVIRNRSQILSENLIKWGKSNCIVTNNDPKDFSFLKGFFDIIIVDAPCSGEGMFRKDPKALDEWSPANVDLCSKRQERILHDIWDALAPEGTLIYSTCTYNEIENEDLISRFIAEKQAFCNTIPLQESWNITEREKNGAIFYRFFPHKTIGEGFSVSVITKQNGDYYSPPKKTAYPKNISIIPQKNRLHYTNLIVNHESIVYERQKDVIWSFSKDYRKLLLDIFAHCNVIHAGIPLVEMMGNKMNPLPGLAFANSFNQTILTKHNVDLETAIRYFKKEPLQLSNIEKGWIHLIYKGISIGFVKNIGNRANNPYPSEWAIKMNIDSGRIWSALGTE